jgi:Gluconate 2-dehydrogenase subunit 3
MIPDTRLEAPAADQPSDLQPLDRSLIDRREAIRRVTALLGGIALVGGNGLLTGCRDRAGEEGAAAAGEFADFTAEEIAFLDEVADTILPTTTTPGAKAAGVGPFMAVMVKDTYHAPEQRTFREGMTTLEEECREMHDVGFMEATPEQRLALLERLDREQWEHTQARERARRERAEAAPAAPADSAEAEAYLPDQRQEAAGTADVGGAAAITADAPPHYFRMMKELALLGYFTSEIGYNQAMRYVEAPGRFDPCLPYTAGEKSWAPHA